MQSQSKIKPAVKSHWSFLSSCTCFLLSAGWLWSSQGFSCTFFFTFPLLSCTGTWGVLFPGHVNQDMRELWYKLDRKNLIDSRMWICVLLSSLNRANFCKIQKHQSMKNLIYYKLIFSYFTKSTCRKIIRGYKLGNLWISF